MIEVNRDGEVWVYAEQQRGELREVVLELCGKARELADQLERTGRSGPDRIEAGRAAAEADRPRHRPRLLHGRLRGWSITRRSPYAHITCQAIETHKPQIVLYGATPLGRDLAPRVASEMRAGMTADCTDLEIQDVTDPRTKEVHEKLLLQIRPAFGGNIIATIVNYDMWPQMATVREGVMPMLDPDTSRSGEVVPLKVTLTDELVRRSS